MKEPDDILKEIRELLGEDVKKTVEETWKEEPKIPVEEAEGIEKLLSEIEKEPEPIEGGLGMKDEGLGEELEIPEHHSARAPEHQEIKKKTISFEEELEKEELPIPIEEPVELKTQEEKIEEAPLFEVEGEEIQEPSEETQEPSAESLQPSEEASSFELEEEEISQESEGRGLESEEEVEEEKIVKEELLQPEQEPKFEVPSEQIEKETLVEPGAESLEPSEKVLEPLASNLQPSEKIPSFEIEKEIEEEFKRPPFDVREEPIEPEEEKLPEEKGSFELEDKAPNKEQKEMEALLKEDVKKKAASPLPKKPIKINKNLIFIPIFILLILGIIGFFGFFHIYPNQKLKSAIGKIKKGRIKEGEDMFNKWINFVFLKNQKMPFYHQLGEAYLSINNPHKASSTFWEAYKIDPNNQATHKYILSSTLKKGGWEKAKEIGELILSKDSRSIPAYLILSRYMRREGEIKKAISYLENGVLKSSPSNLSAISLLQILYFQNKQYDKTISLHRFLIDHLKNKPLNPELVTKSAGYFIEGGKLNIGKPPLEEILMAFPKNIEARYLLALSLVKEKNIEKATEELKTILKNESSSSKGRDKGYPPAYNLLGEILRDEGKYIDALSAFSSAILKDPHFGKAHYNLADTTFYNLNDYSTSIKGYENARKNGYTCPQLSYNLGLSYYLKGRYEEARNEFENLARDKTVLYSIACADSRLKNFNRANVEFKEAESLCKERLKEKISPQEEKGLYLFLSNIYNNLGLISEVLGFSQEAQERYWDAINIAKLSDFEHKEAFSNLTNLFNGRKNSLSSLSDKLDKEYVVQK